MQSHKYRLTTREFADRYNVKPGTVRRGFCVKGHFFGFKPIKLPNNRLIWPDVPVKDLAFQEAAK